MNHEMGSIYGSHMCLAGAVVASRSLIQEVADSSPFTVMNFFFTDF